MIQGLYTALVTPFTPEGALDLEGLRQNIRYQIANRVNGLVVLGTTGESPTIKENEKEQIIQTAVEETRGKCTLMVGTGSYSTSQTIDNTRHARKLGADAALIVTPYYNKPTPEGLYQHYKSIAAAIDIPIMVYNIMGRTGINLTPDFLVRLAKIPSICGIKESSGNMVQMIEEIYRVQDVREDFSFMAGDDPLTIPAIAVGGHGVISVLGNLVPHLMHAMVKAALEGDFHLARSHLSTLAPLIYLEYIETNPIPIKTLMNLAGMPSGPCRLPLCEISAENKVKLQTVLKNYDIHFTV